MGYLSHPNMVLHVVSYDPRDHHVTLAQLVPILVPHSVSWGSNDPLYETSWGAMRDPGPPYEVVIPPDHAP